jgi:ligand-binding sensor domain-containing protein
MPKCLTISLFLGFFLGSYVNSYAQTFPTKRYTTREGLAQMQIMTVFEDSRDILWVGTKGGLSHYDGTNFKTYRRSQGDSLTGDFILNINEDKRGYLWITTPRGISRFDGAKFKTYPFPNPDHHSGTIFVTQKNEIFLFTEKYFLYQLINNKFQEIKFKNLPKYLTETRILHDKITDKLIFQVHESLPKFVQSNYEIIGNSLKFIEKKENELQNIYQYGKYGCVYIYSFPNINKKEYWFQLFGQKDKQHILTVDEKNVKVYHTLPFNFPFTFQSSLTILEKNSADYQVLAGQFLNESIIQVDKGGIWAGTETGLWRVMDNGIRYLPEERDAVSWGVVEDKFNRMWSLHYNPSVPIKIHENYKTTDLSGYIEPLSKQHGKPVFDNWYFNPIKDHYGNLWLGNAGGLVHYDYKTYEFIFKDTYAFYVAEDRPRNLIISSVDGGVNIIENKPPYKTTQLREKDGLLANAQMLCIYVDSQGTHWYGSGGGLTRYDYDKKLFKKYSLSIGNLPFGGIFHISEDSKGTLWFATTRGLFYYDKQKDNFTNIAKQTIWGRVQFVGNFDNDHLICGNLESIYVLNLKDFYRDKSLKIKTFNYSNGFMGLEPAQAGYYKAHDGKIWLGSSSEISIFSPKDLDLNFYAPKPIITKVDSMSIPFVTGEKEQIYDLPHGKSDNIRIEFSSLGFEKSTHPTYSYKIDEGEWSKWQTEEVVNLSNLSAGVYDFKIRTQIVGENNEIKPSESSLKFRASMYPWQSPNFYKYLLALVMVLFGIMLLRWFWEKRLRENFKKQKKELDFLKVVAIQSQMNPHFIFNVLGVLQGHILNGNTKVANEQLVKLSTLVRNYLEASIVDTESTKKTIYSTEITLEKELELLTLFVEFEYLKAKDKFNYKFDISPNINLDSFSIPPMLIQPIVENAIKRGLLNLPDGESGTLNITVSYENETLTFVIIDTGVGRDRAAEIKASTVRTHKSRGIELVNKRIKILNDSGYKITCEDLEDVDPHGTKAVIHFNFKE